METLTLTRWPRTRRPVVAPVWTLAGLKAARAVSLSELADASGLDRSTISRILSGASLATPRTLIGTGRASARRGTDATHQDDVCRHA